MVKLSLISAIKYVWKSMAENTGMWEDFKLDASSALRNLK